MKTFVYTTNTWLVAQLIHPFLFISFFFQTERLCVMQMVEMFLWSCAFSLPSYCLCLVFIAAIKRMEANAAVKFILWIVVAIASVPSGFAAVMAILFQNAYISELISLLLPGCLSALLSILIRHAQFFKLINQPIYTK